MTVVVSLVRRIAATVLEYLGLVLANVVLVSSLSHHLLPALGEVSGAMELILHLAFALCAVHFQRASVMMVVVGLTKHAPVFTVDVLHLAATDDIDSIPALVIPGSLELTNHAVDYLVGYLAVSLALSALALRDRANNDICYCNEVLIESLAQTSKSCLASLRGQVGCVIDYVHSILHCRYGANEHFIKHLGGVLLVIRVAPQLLTNVVRRNNNCARASLDILIGVVRFTGSWLRKSDQHSENGHFIHHLPF